MLLKSHSNNISSHKRLPSIILHHMYMYQIQACSTTLHKARPSRIEDDGLALKLSHPAQALKPYWYETRTPEKLFKVKPSYFASDVGYWSVGLHMDGTQKVFAAQCHHRNRRHASKCVGITTTIEEEHLDREAQVGVSCMLSRGTHARHTLRSARKAKHTRTRTEHLTQSTRACALLLSQKNVRSLSFAFSL